MLIHAEARDALWALARGGMAGRIRLCYIDPPFNTGQDFDSYADRTDHGTWLSCLEERIRLARDLLCPSGFMVVHVNVVEQAYLKVLLDEIFGRDQLVAQVSWQRAPDRTLLGQGNALVSDQVEYLLIYAQGEIPPGWPRPQRRTPFPEKTLRTYCRALEPSTDSRLVGEFRDKRGRVVRIFAHENHVLTTIPAKTLSRAAQAADLELAAFFPRMMRLSNQQPESTFQQELLGHMPDKGVLYRAEYTQDRGKHQGARVRYYLGGQVVLWLKDVATVEDGRLTRVSDLNNFWTAEDIPATGIAREGGVTMRRGKKPERLLERIIRAFSLPGEWVLDFFAGSGTTGAVSERLGRRFVLVEAGPPALALCEPRLAREILRTGGGFTVMTVRNDIQ